MLAKRIKARWSRWLVKRIPPASSVQLNQKRIFILPSSTGAAFALALMLMLMLRLLMLVIYHQKLQLQ